MKTKSKKIPELSRAEYDILSVLWKGDRMTVREVHDQLYATTGWAYSTTKTMMDRMVKKELLQRQPFHGIYLYHALVSRPAGLVRMVQFFADRVLEMDYSAVVSMFARNKTLSSSEVDELLRLLENEEEKG
jgi:predicted transcriptional regulator